MQKLFKEVIQRSNRRWAIGFSVAALLVCAAFGQVSTGKGENKSQIAKDQEKLANIKAGYLSGPLTFEVNRGQTDAKVKFLTRAQGFTVFMMPGETLLRGRNADVLRMKLQNGNPSPKIEGEDRQAKISNYYIGNDRSKWLEGVPNYGQVRYHNVYSGVDMVYHSDQHQLEYDFVVQPGADPNQIHVAFEGADKIRINERGELELTAGTGTSVNHKPVVYQTIAGHRKVVQGEYALANNTVGFKLGAYDKTQPLVIDPTLQVISFFGGTLNDETAGIATNALQAGTGIVIVGRTESVSLGGAAGKSNGINWDGFATGLNAGTPGFSAAGGTTAQWTTYIGGSGDDAARGVAMDNQGNVYVGGYTNSADFPSTAPPVNYDGFLVKLGNGGSRSSVQLYGGPGVDQITSVALDYSTFASLANATSILSPSTDNRVIPNVVVGGFTTGNIGGPGSTTIKLAGGAGNTATTTPDGNQRVFNQCDGGVNCTALNTTDGFVAIFDSVSMGVRHATYLGGGGNDQVNAVAVDIWGNIYATGYATPAVSPVFPVVNGIGQGGAGGVAGGATQDAALNTATVNNVRAAVAFVAKYACAVTDGSLAVPAQTSGVYPIGVPSPAPRIEACAGRNNLSILSNSALFGGSGSFINPQQIAQGQQAISEAGLGIAVDVNGWGSQQVTNNPDGTLEVIPFPTVWGAASTSTLASTVIVGPQAPLVEPCVPPGRNPATPQANSTFCVATPIAGVNNEGGFQPGIAGPRVYVVGSTANANFSTSLTGPSCATGVNTGAGSAPNPAPVPLCAVPTVNGASVLVPGTLPVPGNGPAPIGSFAGTPSGQTQGWLVALQFPAVTQEVITPALTTTPLLATSLAPPTIPLWVTLQPPSCSGLLNPTADNGACVQGAAPVNANLGTSAQPLRNTCSFGGGGVTCPTAFIGSWNGVAVDSDQQVYVVGQMGMSAPRAPIFGAGLSTRLAIEMERINPNGVPELIFPNAGAPVTSSFLIDTAVGGNNYCQILPTAPPSPDPNQPGGLNCGIALNQFREAFLAGTTTATAPVAPPAPAQASATANITNTPGSVTIGVCPTPNPAPGGGGATGGPICPAGQTGGAGYAAGALAIVVNNVTCTTAPGPFTVTVDGNGAITAINPAVSGAGCVAAGGSPTVTIPAPPAAPATPFSLLFSPINAALNVPTGTSAFNISGSGNSKNASTGGATEDVIYSAIQFYDAIASPSTIDFTATVNSVPSITGPDGTTGAVGNPAVPNAKAFINFVNWQGQPLNIPPGCVITPNVAAVTNPAAFGGAASYTPFTVSPVPGTSQFIVTINNPATVVGFPGVISSLVTFQKTGPCSGNGPVIEGFDPVRITMAVSAPINAVPENTLQVTSALASGILQPYFNNGVQLVANNGFSVNVDVSTANASAPINVTAEIVPGQNWSGSVINAFTVGNPNGRNNTLWSVAGPGQGGGLRAIPINVNPAVISTLPVGTYTATLVIAASPETPALPTSGSTACNSPATPLGSGTTSAVCLPISITVTPQAITNIPAAIVFQGSNTPQQTGLNIANPLGTTGPFNFTALYQPTPIYGTALPAANVFYVGTGTTLTSAVGNTVSGSIASGGTFTVPIQVNPAGLPTGVYSGQLLVSNNGLASGATPQTTVPLIVYVGPHTGEDTPSGNGLGLMLPVNTPPVGTGVLPGTAQATVNPTASSPGAYPLILSVPSGYGATGGNPALNPTIVQVTGLNNTSTTPFNVNPPIVQGFPAGTVTVTNPTAGFGGTPGVCSSTFSQQTSLPGTPLGPSCAYALWVDATTLNSSNTQQLAVCGTPGNNFGLTGSLLFTPAPNSFPFASFTVPVTVCVTDFPALIVAMPMTFPNPTFGPFFTTGNPQGIAQPANVAPGFQQVLVDMQIAAGAGCTGAACVAGPISLFAQAGNSSQVCKVLDLHTNGGIVPNVTIAPIGNQWLTVQPAPALFRGAVGTLNAFGVGAIGGLPVALGAQFAAGPLTAGPGMSTFQVCANTDPLGNVAGTFSSAIVINGAGVGAVTIPVNFIVGNAGSGSGGGTGTGSPANFSQLAVFRPTNQPPAMAFFLDSNGNNTWDACVPGTERTSCTNDKIRFFGNDAIAAAGTARDIAVAGDWDGTGVVRFGVFHCAASGLTQCAWYIDLNNNGVWDGTAGGDAIWIFGIPGDTPVVGDWTGDGKSKIGVFRCTAGLPECQWFLDLGNKHTWDAATAGVYRFGLPGDKPAVGTWTPGSSADQVGVMHCTTAGAACTWIVDSLGKTGTAGFNAELFDPGDRMFSFTGPGGFVVGDVPVVGNWNGNGTKRAGVFRTSTGVWYVDTNGNGSLDPADQVFTGFGLPGDQPLVGFWTLPGAQLVQ